MVVQLREGLKKIKPLIETAQQRRHPAERR